MPGYDRTDPPGQKPFAHRKASHYHNAYGVLPRALDTNHVREEKDRSIMSIHRLEAYATLRRRAGVRGEMVPSGSLFVPSRDALRTGKQFVSIV